jgi:hypothetical protein
MTKVNAFAESLCMQPVMTPTPHKHPRGRDTRTRDKAHSDQEKQTNAKEQQHSAIKVSLLVGATTQLASYFSPVLHMQRMHNVSGPHQLTERQTAVKNSSECGVY